MSDDLKNVLLRYLNNAREAMLWKLEGLDEYDLRRPLTPTGTNLLGLVKHMATVELGYLGDSMGRPAPVPLPWTEADWADNADMYATADESVEHITDLLQLAGRHSAESVAAFELDAPARVPWWGDNGNVTLGRLLVHLLAEFDRHLGQADILREHLDGAAGLRRDADNLGDPRGGWPAYRERLQTLAEQVRDAGH